MQSMQESERDSKDDCESIGQQRTISRQSRVSQNQGFPSTRIRKYCSVKKKTSDGQDYVSLSPTHYGLYLKNSPIQRSSLSPNRKQLYWQSWMLPNSAMSQSCMELPPQISAQSYCVLIGDSNQVLISSNANDKLEIASLTKIMTAYTVLCICHHHGIKIREHSITIHQQASNMEGTSANLRIGDQLLVNDLLYGLLLPSGNDAAIALSQYFGKFLSFKLAKDNTLLSGNSVKKFKDHTFFYDKQYKSDSIKLFVFEMNKNCHKIGLKNTYFSNPTGLSDTRTYSTAKDIAVLTAHCLKNHILRSIFKKKSYICDAKNQKLATVRQLQWKNTNRHLFQFRQCMGVKTGITPNAGPCLSSAYKIMGREIVVIILKCASVDQRYNDAENLYKYARKKVREV